MSLQNCGVFVFLAANAVPSANTPMHLPEFEESIGEKCPGVFTMGGINTADRDQTSQSSSNEVDSDQTTESTLVETLREGHDFVLGEDPGVAERPRLPLFDC